MGVPYHVCMETAVFTVEAAYCLSDMTKIQANDLNKKDHVYCILGQPQ